LARKGEGREDEGKIYCFFVNSLKILDSEAQTVLGACAASIPVQICESGRR
jgi:hypothetical protein